MPRVPVYEQQVKQRPLSPDYQNINYRAGVDQVGNAMQQLGGNLQQVSGLVDKAREQEERSREDDADLELARHTGQLFYDDRKGFMLQQGENALDAAPVLDSISKKRDEIAGRLQGPSRERFLARANARILGWTNEIERHSGSARREVHEQTAAGLVQVAADEIAKSPDNPDVLATQSGLARDALVRHVRDDLGWPPERVQAAVAGLEQDLVGRALDGLIQRRDYAKAETLLNLNRERMGGRAGQYDTKLQAYRDQAAVEEARASIRTSSLADDAHPWLDPKKIASQVEAFQGTAEQKKALREQLEDDLQANSRQRTLANAQMFNQGLVLLQKNGWNINDPALVEVKTYLQDLPNEGGKHWQDLLDKADSERAQARARAAGKPPKGETPKQRDSMVKLRVDMAQNPEKYLAMTVEEFSAQYVPLLSSRDYEEAGRLLAGIKGQGAKPDANNALPTLTDKALKDAGEKAKLWGRDPKKWSAGQSDAYYFAVNELQEKEREYRRSHRGEAPPLAEQEKWIAETIAPVVVKGGGTIYGDKTVPRAKAKTDEDYRDKPQFASEEEAAAAAKAEEEKASAAAKHRVEVEEILRGKGIVPTTDAIEWMLARERGENPPKPKLELYKDLPSDFTPGLL